jgi:hypothetical protein
MTLGITTAAVIIVGVMLVIALIFIGFYLVKPESLRLSVKWNALEFELRRQQPTRTRRRTVKPEPVPSEIDGSKPSV